MKNKPSLSIVLPCFNEEDIIENSYLELMPLLESWLIDLISEYEIVMVNNGSTDNTLNCMLKIKANNKHVRIVNLRSNFGYQGSITAGLYHANKDMIVSIDADLQDDPTKIGDMIKSYKKGYDMVLGVREDRQTDNFFKRITAQLFYKFMNYLGAKSVYNHGDFRLLSKELVSDLKKYPEKNRYLRGMILMLDYKYEIIRYKRRQRQAGETKFKPTQLFSLALDGITSFSIAPVRFVFILGLVMFLVSVTLGIIVLGLKIFSNIYIQGWASIMIIILFFGGIQNISLGILGIYISKTYIESKNRPIFIVKEII